MWEFLVGYANWPNVMWPLIVAAVALFTYIGSKDKVILNHWAASLHFMVVATSGLSFIFGVHGAPQDGIYRYLSPHAFWLNLVMMCAHLVIYFMAVREEDAARLTADHRR
jgi:hypothetical protein